MTYWHMQLHPNDPKWGNELELLEKKELIGLGLTKSDIAYMNFKNDMEINDIVLIKRGSTVLALVQVIGNCEDIETNDEDRLDWFRYRRKIKILSTDTENLPAFPQPRKTIQKAFNKYTLTYKYIDNWYRQYKKQEKNDIGLKIKKIKIDDYKMFKDFEIDFVDENKIALPLIVIVGKNGTGKTSLFNYLTEVDDNTDKSIGIEYTWKNKNHKFLGNGVVIDNIGFSNSITEFKNNIIYLKAGIIDDEGIKELEALFLDYIDYFIYEKSLSSKDGYEAMKNDLNDIFGQFDLGFEFNKLDFKDKKPIFIDKSTERFNDIAIKLNDLSTGEKTLLSKIFYLYLKEPKNKVILIDEPELSLHPSWQNKVVDIYEKFAKINNNQIIIATHSPHILTSVNNKYIRVLKKDEKGNIIAVKDNIFANGRDMNSVLFDVMGEVMYRPKEFSEMIDEMYAFIDANKYHKAEELFTKLKSSYGENDTVIIEAKMALEMMEPEFKL